MPKKEKVSKPEREPISDKLSKTKQLSQALDNVTQKYKSIKQKILYQYRDAKTPEEVEVFMDLVPLITDPEKLATLPIDRAGLVKEKLRECPIDPRITIKDLMLDTKGPLEDKVYAQDPELSRNVRRGNTLLEIKQEDGTFKHVIGRKGLVKFFDLAIEYVDP